MDSHIGSLQDLRNLRSAPDLDDAQSKVLIRELSTYMDDSDWFTVGIMAPSFAIAILVLREMESRFNWLPMKVVVKPKEEGPVFLKANQKAGEVNVRVEHGLGEGILLSCQRNDLGRDSDTLGPFPLNFFNPVE